jgi:hypothetical protein
MSEVLIIQVILENSGVFMNNVGNQQKDFFLECLDQKKQRVIG